MPQARLVIHQPGSEPRYAEVPGGRVTIGRAPDNTISLAGDTNVSRYHAIIESRGEEFFVIDLRSANGTTVNGAPVEVDRRLKDGDLVSIGGVSTIEFHQSGVIIKDEGVMSAGAPAMELGAPSVALPSSTPAPGGISPVVLMASIGGALLLVGIVAIIFIYKFSGGCNASVRIISPPSGTNVRGAVTIRTEAEGTKCIDRVIFQLDGEKLASAEVAPYDIVFDADKIPDLNGGQHILSVTVEDNDGNKKLQPDTVLLAFETKATRTVPEDATNTDSQTGQNTSTQSTQGGQTAGPSGVNVFDVKDMVSRLSKKISSKNDYVFDRDFLEQVRLRTGDYTSAGFFERARNFRDVINDAFIGEQGIEAPLGYVIAMSRTRFDLNKARAVPAMATSVSDPGQGLWLIQPSLAQATGYMGRCGTQTLADPDQKCSAIVASMYTKFLDVDIFSGDYLYAIASFGSPPKEAAQFRDSLPPDRRDFWKVLKSPEQRDRVVRFFAAGIVAENPDKFGLGRDKPISNLYPKK